MKRFLFFGILIFLVSSCAGPSKKEGAENFMVRRGHQLMAKGSLQLDRGCFRQGAADFTLAYDNFQASDHLPGMAQALNNLAVCLLELQETEKAALLASRALTINRSLGDASGQAANLSVLGKVHLIRGEDKAALRLWQEALDNARNGSQELKGKILNDLGVAFMHAGQIKQARTHLNLALDLIPDSPAVHQNLGKIAELSGHLSTAENHYVKALEIDRKKGDTPGIASDLAGLGKLYLKMDRKSEAAEILARAIGLRVLLSQKDKADALREDLRRAGLKVAVPAGEPGGVEYLPPCQ
ncbi:MAG: tetratricopeptide repeat protein [Desulfobacterales bacterium]